MGVFLRCKLCEVDFCFILGGLSKIQLFLIPSTSLAGEPGVFESKTCRYSARRFGDCQKNG